jgi:hypothetical protein
MAKARYQQFENDKADLFYRVKSSWYTLNKYHQEMRLVEENLTFLQTFEKLALVRFQSGRIFYPAGYKSTAEYVPIPADEFRKEQHGWHEQQSPAQSQSSA